MATLLSVDDSPSVRQMISATLRSAGFDVLEAADGYEGLEKAKVTPIDLVITDLNMPQLNGLALIRHLRAMPSLVGIPIIVLTTESDETASKEAKAAGATAWITKPFKPDHLISVVTGLLR
jgi:two-component system chemotaxis response regulator CheY